MKIIKPDYDRRIQIDGVPNPVRRPVDVDQSKTGFQNLRALRIYRFDPGSAIDGHAEEDELFIILLAGSAELAITAEGKEYTAAVLSGELDSETVACAAYLPPHAAYRLVPLSECHVAYARATPVRGRDPKFFHPLQSVESGVLFSNTNYAEKLRVRLIRHSLNGGEISVGPMSTKSEVLVHIREVVAGSRVHVAGAGFAETSLESWDTLALTAGDPVSLKTSARGSILALILSADG